MTGPFVAHARELIVNGYSPVPIRPGEKRPIPIGWETLRETAITEEQIQEVARHWPHAGLGVAGGFNGLVPVDVDVDDENIRAAIGKALPAPVVVKTGKRGATPFYRSRLLIPGRKFRDTNGKTIAEVLTTVQTVIPPTMHPDTRKPYRYATAATLLDTCIDDLSEIAIEHLAALQEALRPWLAPPRARRPHTGNGAGARRTEARLRAYAAGALAGEAKQLAKTGEGGRNHGLFAAVCRLGNYVHHHVLSESEMHAALFDACNANGFNKEHGSAAFEKTFANGLRWSEEDELREPLSEQYRNGRDDAGARAGGATSNNMSEDRPLDELPLTSDEALALKFAELHSEELRYTHAWGKWHCFDGRCWREDVTLTVYDQARKLCRETAVTVKEREAKDTASAKKRAAIVTLGREDRRTAATVEEWDRDPWLLNTPAGTIDLRTGEMRPHRASDYITKITSVAPGGECPRWLRFLAEITDGNTELMAYMQRCAGYLLTGDTREHAFFFFYGTGANGKSVFLSTVAGIFGDYHRAAPIETFTASMSDRHPTELAMLRGARLTTAVETEEGRHWAETRIKLLTGGDKVSARFMRQDFFEYTPEFKLLIAGNHKPALRSVDEAMRRRLHLVPFTVTIEAGKRDLQLAEKLKAQWPGILQWAIDGCAMWQKHGLAPPMVVTEATAAYLEDEDPVLAWIADRCTKGKFSPLKELYGSWRAYAEAIGEDPRTNRWFRQKLEALGYRSRKVEFGIAVFGLELNGT